MTNTQALLIIGAVALATIITRALPFVLFPAGKNTPKFIVYLGKALPAAAIGMLVVYCLKDIQPLRYPNGIPELIAALLVVVLQSLKKNTLLSIAGGTLAYMLLVQFVFVV